MASIQIKMQDLDKIIHKAKQGDNWSGIVYNNGIWQISLKITARITEFLAKVQYKNGKSGIVKIIINPDNSNEYTITKFPEQIKLPVIIQNRIRLIFNHINSNTSYVKDKSRNVTNNGSDSNEYTIGLKTCFDILKLDSNKKGTDHYILDDRYIYYHNGDHILHDIVQDRKGDVYIYLGKFSEFRFWKTRPTGDTTRTGLPGENDKFLVNVDYSGKHIYLPIISPETLLLFRKSICYGIVKNIEQQVEKLNIRYIKDLAHDEKLRIVFGFRIASSKSLTDKYDFNNEVYNGEQNKDMLNWKWKYNTCEVSPEKV